MNFIFRKLTDNSNSKITLIDGRICYVFDKYRSLGLEINVSALDVYKSPGDGDENK